MLYRWFTRRVFPKSDFVFDASPIYEWTDSVFPDEAVRWITVLYACDLVGLSKVDAWVVLVHLLEAAYWALIWTSFLASDWLRTWQLPCTEKKLIMWNFDMVPECLSRQVDLPYIPSTMCVKMHYQYLDWFTWWTVNRTLVLRCLWDGCYQDVLSTLISEIGWNWCFQLRNLLNCDDQLSRPNFWELINSTQCSWSAVCLTVKLCNCQRTWRVCVHPVVIHLYNTTPSVL